MKWFTAVLFLVASVWAAIGDSGIGVGLWGTLFVASVLLPHVWRAHQLLVPVGYVAALITLWARDQWVFVAMSAMMAVLSMAGL